MVDNNLFHCLVIEERHEALVALGVEIMNYNRHGETPLLLTVNAANKKGETPLILAIKLVIEQKHRHIAKPPFGRPHIDFELRCKSRVFHVLILLISLRFNISMYSVVDG